VDCFPEGFRTEALRETWPRFEQYRRERKQKIYTPTGITSLAAMCVNSGVEPDELPKVIEFCMASGWNGIPANVISDWASRRKSHPGTKPIEEKIVGATGGTNFAERLAEEMA
jgi:hypothetical protein